MWKTKLYTGLVEMEKSLMRMLGTSNLTEEQSRMISGLLEQTRADIRNLKRELELENGCPLPDKVKRS